MTRRIRPLAPLAALLAGLCVVFSCTPNEPIEISATFAYTGGNPVYPIDFQDADILHLTVTGTFTNQDLFLVKANASDYLVSAGNAGGFLGASRGVDRLLSVPGQASVGAVAGRSPDRPVALKDHPAAVEFNRNPPPFRTTPPGVLSRSPVGPTAVVYYGTGSSPTSPRDFWVQDVNGSWVQKSASLEYSGYYCYVWVEADSLGAGPNKITSAEAQAIGQVYDGTSGNAYEDGIYELVSSVYGYEYGGGSGGHGGADGDQHVSILIYDIDYDYGAAGAKMVGYFWAKDEYTQASLDADYGVGALYTNLAEMFYLDTEFVESYNAVAVSTLAHEYQHMINFNEKWVEYGVASPTWYNEMLSMLAEDLLQDHLALDDADSPKSRTYDFNDAYYASGVTDWLYSDVLASYASAYMFGAFLARNYGGAELVQSIMANPYAGRQSVTDALGELFNPEDFDDVFRAYAPALIYSTPPAAGIKVINTSDVTTIGTIDYTLSAFDIYTYPNSVPDWGPVVFYASYPLALRPFGLSIHSENPWLNLSGAQSFTISLAAPSPSVATYLMVR